MAEIPVEKKSNMTWLWVGLALLAAALLLWWLLADDDNDDRQMADPLAVETVAVDTVINPVADPNQVGGPITDIATLLPAIPAAMVGREVQLTGVRVLDVISDAGFWIGDGPERRLYAVLSEQRTPRTPTEGEADVNSGATANVTGTIRTRQEALQGLAAGTETDALPTGIDHFIVVSNYQVQNPSQ